MLKTTLRDGVAATMLLAVGTLLTAIPTQAADLLGPRDQLYDAFEPQSAVHRRFYVRGDVGVARNSPGRFSQQELLDNGGSFLSQSLDDTVYVGAGIGWQVSSRLRFDMTGEYRGSAQLRALDNLSVELADPSGTLQANTSYQGSITSYVGLLNAYWDILNYRGMTPYIGAGIGMARTTVSDVLTASAATFTDAATGAQTISLTNGVGKSNTESSLAWALMAGASFDISANGKLDIGYRYLNLGSGIAASSGILDCVCGTVGGPLKMADLDAHEFRIGIRWMLDAGHPSYAPMK